MTRKNRPKKDGSGKGVRTNRGRGGCKRTSKVGKGRGWYNQPGRHALASKGIKTSANAKGSNKSNVSKGKNREEEFEEAKEYRLETDEGEVQNIFEELFPEEDTHYSWVGDKIVVERWQDELHIFEVTPLREVMSQKERMDILEDNMNNEELMELFKEKVPKHQITDLKDKYDIEDTEELVAFNPEIAMELLTDNYGGPYSISMTYTEADELAEYINTFPQEESQMGGWAKIEIHNAEELKEMDVEDFISKYITDTSRYSADPYDDYRHPYYIGRGLYKEKPFDIKSRK